jgi:hypothetical protein
MWKKEKRERALAIVKILIYANPFGGSSLNRCLRVGCVIGKSLQSSIGGTVLPTQR